MAKKTPDKVYKQRLAQLAGEMREVAIGRPYVIPDVRKDSPGDFLSVIDEKVWEAHEWHTQDTELWERRVRIKFTYTAEVGFCLLSVAPVDGRLLPDWLVHFVVAAFFSNPGERAWQEFKSEVSLPEYRHVRKFILLADKKVPPGLVR
jgi:hypothetical protein